MSLKEDVLAVMEEVESNKIFPESIRKQVPMLLFL